MLKKIGTKKEKELKRNEIKYDCLFFIIYMILTMCLGIKKIKRIKEK